MITVQVSYTVKEGFAAQNTKNIEAFLQDFEKLDSGPFSYNVFLKEDGKTFVHVSQYQDKQVQGEVLKVPSFLSFQQQRDESGLEGAPAISVLNWIGGTGVMNGDEITH